MVPAITFDQICIPAVTMRTAQTARRHLEGMRLGDADIALLIRATQGAHRMPTLTEDRHGHTTHPDPDFY